MTFGLDSPAWVRIETNDQINTLVLRVRPSGFLHILTAVDDPYLQPHRIPPVNRSTDKKITIIKNAVMYITYLLIKPLAARGNRDAYGRIYRSCGQISLFQRQFPSQISKGDSILMYFLPVSYCGYFDRGESNAK